MDLLYPSGTQYWISTYILSSPTFILKTLYGLLYFRVIIENLVSLSGVVLRLIYTRREIVWKRCSQWSQTIRAWYDVWNNFLSDISLWTVFVCVRCKQCVLGKNAPLDLKSVGQVLGLLLIIFLTLLVLLVSLMLFTTDWSDVEFIDSDLLCFQVAQPRALGNLGPYLLVLLYDFHR